MSSNEYRYGFNGMEKDDDGEWGDLTHYTTNNRQYNSGIGRFLSVDPMASLAADWTPYRFGFNNPVSFVDPDGLFEKRRHARRYRRKENIEGDLVKLKDGTFAIRNLDYNSIIWKENDEIHTAAFAARSGIFKQEEPKPNLWAGLKNGPDLRGRMLYDMANGVNVFARQWFYPRGGRIPTLDGEYVVKGSDEGIMTGLDGMMTVVPGVGGLSTAKTTIKSSPKPVLEIFENFVPRGKFATRFHTRTVEEVALIRKAFEKSGGAREEFLKHLASQPGAIQKYGEKGVKKMLKGKPPKDMVVHHKQPIFRGGTNNFDNLDLIDGEFHRANNKTLHWYPEGQNPYGKN